MHAICIILLTHSVFTTHLLTLSLSSHTHLSLSFVHPPCPVSTIPYLCITTCITLPYTYLHILSSPPPYLQCLFPLSFHYLLSTSLAPSPLSLTFAQQFVLLFLPIPTDLSRLSVFSTHILTLSLPAHLSLSLVHPLPHLY